jgi:asparagine synthase (glutamine-hydrolysing)
MCGIIGYAIHSYTADLKNYYKNKFEHYFRKQKHRGPDYQQIINDKFKDVELKLGFNRLAIIDLSNRSNKIFKNAHFCLLFNGEIYNYKKLKQDYLKNEKFDTETDTEVLYKLISIYGIEFVKKLEGIFSFVFIDKLKSKIYLVRDFTGTKPLYYSTNKHGLFFSSEAWFQYSISNKQINTESFKFYLTYGFSPINQTLIDNVKKIEPGTYITYDLEKKTYTKNNYFELTKKKSSEFDKEGLSELISETIKKNLITDTKIGIFLSGGLDSSLLAVTAKEFSPNIEGYTSYFSPKDRFSKFNVDLDYAIKISDYLGIKLNFVRINTDDKNQKLELINSLNYLDEPLPNLNFFNSYLQSKAASQNNCKVILTGDGADEVFGGYKRYSNIKIAEYLKFIGFVSDKINKINKISKNETPSHFYKKINLNNNKNLFSNKYNFSKLIACKDLIAMPEWEKVEVMNYFDTKYWLSEESNFKLDRSTMINSIEGRVPFQDINLLNKIFPIPYEYKSSIFSEKKLIKKYCKKIPDFIKNRKKHGWFVPESAYLDTYLKDIFFEYFDKKNIKKQGIFDYITIQSMHKEHCSGKKNFKTELINLLSFQIWYNNVLKLY